MRYTMRISDGTSMRFDDDDSMIDEWEKVDSRLKRLTRKEGGRYTVTVEEDEAITRTFDIYEHGKRRSGVSFI